ncbi:uncharacterized protein BN814_02142 [Veillonella sp. CAG:933]|nr:uncharacterized protein BN814_02142 [Veillonella sp. CAG:933]
MVFMTVSDNYGTYFILVFNQITHVRDDNVNARHIVFRERKTCIQYDNIIAILEYGHVLTDFTETAQRNNHELIFFARMMLMIRMCITIAVGCVTAINIGTIAGIFFIAIVITCRVSTIIRTVVGTSRFSCAFRISRSIGRICVLTTRCGLFSAFAGCIRCTACAWSTSFPGIAITICATRGATSGFAALLCLIGTCRFSSHNIFSYRCFFLSRRFRLISSIIALAC